MPDQNNFPPEALVRLAAGPLREDETPGDYEICITNTKGREALVFREVKGIDHFPDYSWPTHVLVWTASTSAIITYRNIDYIRKL